MIDEKVINSVLENLKKDGYGCFSSEAQLRDAFAIKLGSVYPNCVVIPEYTQHIPQGWALNEKRCIFFDLLIKDCENDELILVEFKYKTKKGSFKIHNNVDLDLSNQADTTNGRYAIWRDIYRIEEFVNNYGIAKGFMVFITNNNTYYAKPNNNNLDVDFSIEQGLHTAGNKSWNLIGHNINSIHQTYLRDNRPLQIANDYYFNYTDYSVILDTRGKSHTFKQLVVPVYSKKMIDELEKKLRTMGKSVFIEFYDDLKRKDYKKIRNEMSNRYTMNSINTRLNCGKQIFNDKREVEALRLILASSKVKEKIRKLAKEK